MSSQNQMEEEGKPSSPFETRSFLTNDNIRVGEFFGEKGFFIKVQLTSYRSLPLSCIQKIELRVDGKKIEPEKMTFVLNGFGSKLADMPKLRHIFWWILDPAEIFVPDKDGLAAGEHLVEGNLVTVEPYMTAGRDSFEHPCQKRLMVEPVL